MTAILATALPFVLPADPTEAGGKGIALCVTSEGVVVTRSGSCLRGEQAVASGRYKVTALPAKKVRMGRNVVSDSPHVSERSDAEDYLGAVLEADELLESTLLTVTKRFTIPAMWAGRINAGGCPTRAPVRISGDVYSPQWSIAGKENLPGVGGDFELSGWVLRRSEKTLNGYVDAYIQDLAAYPYDPRLPFDLYVILVCAPIVGPEPTG